jgi:hypothetical protein
MRKIMRVMLLLLPHICAAQQGPSQQLAAASAAPPAAVARALTAVRANTPITVDGKIDEAAWAGAAPAHDFVQFEPRPGVAASERTEARVLFDADAIYVGVRMYDAAPDSIVAQLARRDDDVYADWFLVGIDSYYDRRSAFEFAINAAGVKRDAKVSDDDREDASWDAVWSGAAHVDSLGWTAELRIPWSQLRFNGADNRSVWGINFRRALARRSETSYWAPVPNNGGGLVSFYGELHGMGGIEQPRRVEAMPYTVARLTRAPGTTDDPFFRPNALFGGVGADVKAGITPALTMTATINPDFGQVEADPSVVNLSAYETFLQERRPFFVEGDEYFRLNGTQLFYSRRIGRAPQGFVPGDAGASDMPAAATILGAAKVSGKTSSGWSVGLLDALTSEERAQYVTPAGGRQSVGVEPLTNYAVGRIAREFRRGKSAVGAMFTATDRKLDDANLVFLRSAAYTGGLEARHRFGADHFQASARLIGSSISGDASAIARVQRGAGHYFQRPDADHVTYDPTRTSLSGVSAAASVAKVAGGHWRWSTASTLYSPGYEINDLGYNFASDRISQNTSLGYYEFQPHGIIKRWSAQAQQFTQLTFGGERMELNGTLQTDVEFANSWSAGIWTMRHTPGLAPDALRGGPALRRPARWMLQPYINTDRRKTVSAMSMAYYEPEDQTDGQQLQLMSTIEVRPSARISISAGPSYSLGVTPAQFLTTRTVSGTPNYLVARLEQRTAALETRLSYAFSSTLSFQFYAQPFVSAGSYTALQKVVAPRAATPAAQFHRFDASDMSLEQTPAGRRIFHIDTNRDGAADVTVDEPDFNFKQIRSNAVLRWEYRPGSALFVVWSQDRTAAADYGSFALGRDLQDLFRERGRNVLLIKLSYWLGM